MSYSPSPFDHMGLKEAPAAEDPISLASGSSWSWLEEPVILTPDPVFLPSFPSPPYFQGLLAPDALKFCNMYKMLILFYASLSLWDPMSMSLRTVVLPMFIHQ